MSHQSPGGRHPVELQHWREFRRGGSVVWRLKIHCPTEEEVHQWISAGSEEETQISSKKLMKDASRNNVLTLRINRLK